MINITQDQICNTYELLINNCFKIIGSNKIGIYHGTNANNIFNPNKLYLIDTFNFND